MKHHERSKPSIGKVVAALEVCLGQKEDDPYVAVVVSIPGREGTLVRRWGQYGRALTVPEAEDLTLWVNVTLRHCFMAHHGLQAVLPME